MTRNTNSYQRQWQTIMQREMARHSSAAAMELWHQEQFQAIGHQELCSGGTPGHSICPEAEAEGSRNTGNWNQVQLQKRILCQLGVPQLRQEWAPCKMLSQQERQE